MALKVITPSFNAGFDPVGSDDYRAGQVAAYDSTGKARLCGNETAATTNGPLNKAIGLFGEDKITTILQATDQVLEQITLTSGTAVALAHKNLVTGSTRVTNIGTATVAGVAAGADYTLTTQYTVDLTNGTVTSVNIPSATVVGVSYFWKLSSTEQSFRGVNFKGSQDDTAGSGKSTVWKGYGEFQTDQFVTRQSYKVGDALRVTWSGHDFGAGFLTNEGSGTNVINEIVGRVNKVPTAADPFLGFDWQGSVGATVLSPVE